MIEENIKTTELKETELTEMKSQIELYETEMNKAGDTITQLESENETLANQNAILNEENQDLQAQFRAHYLNDSSISETAVTNNGDEHKDKVHKVAPRLFCDICDEFDLHETEDCPQQLMQDQNDDKSLHSKHDAAKVVIRAYCDICESFGHEEIDCTAKIDKAPSDEEF